MTQSYDKCDRPCCKSVNCFANMSVAVENALNNHGYTAEHNGQIFFAITDDRGYLTPDFALHIKPLTQKETK